MKQELNVTPRGRKIEVIGEVVSDKMDKTIAVRVYKTVRHEKYGKYQKSSVVFKAHDEKNEAKMGDKVVIRESRPMSRTKRWKLVSVMAQGD